MATGYQRSFGPEAQSDPVASFLHWVFVGNRPGAGLDAVPGQLASSFDPRHPEGLLNLASMFVGGPRGDATPQMEALGLKGQFAPYDASVGHPLERGLTLEGPGIGNKGAGIRGLIRRAQGVNPLRRVDPIKAANARHALLERQTAQALQRQQMLRAMAARNRLDAHLGSAPMAGHAEHPAPEHDYFNSPEFEHILERPHADPHIQHGADARQALLQHLLQRRYQAGSSHHHN